MGTFEKLGILVIVVIIVMILAVAIYQWGGAGGPGATAAADSAAGELIVKDLDDLIRQDEAAAKPPPAPPVDAATNWPGGIPKRYRIARDDKVWVLVVKRWGLKDSFIEVIEKANPKIDFKRLKPGAEIVVPDPSAYVRTAAEKAPQQQPKGGRLYEIKAGDTLESIAFLHLGSKGRWKEIVAMNPGLDPKRLSEGQEIYLPAK